MNARVRRSLRHPLFPALPTVSARNADAHATAIAGTFEELSLARICGAQASRAIFPLLAVADPLLSASERDKLWELFQVPAYALILDEEDRIIAFECEAQDGLHLLDAEHPPGEVETQPCDCGWPGVRWTPTRV